MINPLFSRLLEDFIDNLRRAIIAHKTVCFKFTFVFILIISCHFKHCHFFSAFEKLLISLCFVKGVKASLTQQALDKSKSNKV